MRGRDGWDCLIVGAGPAGSTAAWKLAERGRSVLLIEKRQEIGVPVRCGEGISKQLLDIIGLEPDGRWISSEMDGAIIHSPSMIDIVLGPEIAGPEVGYVIQRDNFDQALARKAARAGAVIEVRAEALSMKRVDNGWNVRIKDLNGVRTERASMVIAADGFESHVASWAGIDTSLSLKNMDTCIQYEMVGVEVVDRFTEFYLGRKKAPGGYVWCFPKGKDIANIGLGINGSMISGRADPKKYLDDFIRNDERFNKGTVTEINGGGVSVSLPIEKTVSDNFLVIGDAARMIDPLTGGGVYNGCYAALQAAITVDEAMEMSDLSANGLLPFERRWRDHLENEMVRNFLAKEKLLEVSDEILDKVIDAIAGYDLKEVNTEELLKAIASKYPEILDDISI